MREPRYEPSPIEKKAGWTARFALSGFGAPDVDTTLLVGSDRAGGLIYRGPLVADFHIQASERWLEREAHDNFRFVLIHPAQRQICVTEHSGAFWRANRMLVIERLRVRRSNAAVEPVAFSLTSRAP